MRDQSALRFNHVMNGDDWKSHAVGLTRTGVGGRRAGGSVATSQDIRADDEVARSIEESARPDEWIPPRYLCIIRVFGMVRMRISGERMGNQNGIITSSV